MMDFLLGTVFGAVLMGVSFRIYEIRKNINVSLKPIYKFLEIPMKEVSFISRKGHLVTLLYRGYTFYLSLEKKELYISENDEVIIVTDVYNGKECEYLFDRLYNAFNTEINVDIMNYGGITISNNLIKKNKLNVPDTESENNVHVPDLDEILDKISSHGIDSLTQREIDILNNHSTND